MLNIGILEKAKYMKSLKLIAVIYIHYYPFFPFFFNTLVLEEKIHICFIKNKIKKNSFLCDT